MLRKLLLNFITYSLGKCYRMSFQWVKESFRSSLNTFYIYVHNFFIIIVFQNLVVWQPWQQKNVSKVGFLNFLLFSTSYYIFEEMKALKIMQEIHEIMIITKCSNIFQGTYSQNTKTTIKLKRKFLSDSEFSFEEWKSVWSCIRNREMYWPFYQKSNTVVVGNKNAYKFCDISS